MIRGRVESARKIQLERYKDESIYCNGELDSKLLFKYIDLTENAKKMGKMLYDKYKLNNRTYVKLLKIAITISDLKGKNAVEDKDLLEAFSYRNAYYKYFFQNRG